MKRLLLVCFLFSIFIVNNSIAQSFPNLNASSGNAGEFPVDKDTNTYMFHGNRLVKTDKNFNPIWALTYGNINFTHLLLSKTGSMFFIADKSIGKIESNGTLSWSKNLTNIPAVISGSTIVNYATSQINSILLDRNDHLIVTANSTSTNFPIGYYLKLDTLGNPIKLAVFEGNLMHKFSIVNDSLGHYRFFGGGGPAALSICYTFGCTVFNDISNNFTSGIIYITPDTQCWESYNLVRSQFKSGFYVNLKINYNYNLYPKTCVLKCNLNGQIKWGRAFDNCLPPAAISVVGISGSLVEDNSGNIFLQVVRANSSAQDPAVYGVLKIDSNGVTNNFAIITHSSSTWPQYCSVQKIAGADLYTDFVANGHPISPLTLNTFKSSLSSNCYTSSSCNSFGAGGSFSTIQTPTIHLVTSCSISSQNIASATATFAANTSSCTLLNGVGLNELEVNENLFNIFPNPVNNKLNLISKSNALITKTQISDVHGKVVKTFTNETELEINELGSGIYFLNIQTEYRSYHQKFIKE